MFEKEKQEKAEIIYVQLYERGLWGFNDNYKKFNSSPFSHSFSTNSGIFPRPNSYAFSEAGRESWRRWRMIVVIMMAAQMVDHDAKLENEKRREL